MTAEEKSQLATDAILQLLVSTIFVPSPSMDPKLIARALVATAWTIADEAEAEEKRRVAVAK